MPTAIPNTLWPQGPVRGNLIRGSNSLSDTSLWARGTAGGGVITSITPNYATAPDGTQTATRFVLSKSPSTGYAVITQVPGHVYEKGKIYIASVWLKNNSDNPCVIKYYCYKAFGSPQYTVGGIDPALTGEWRRYWFSCILASPYQIEQEGTQYSLSLGISGGTDSDSVDFLAWGLQLIESPTILPGAYVETDELPIGPEPSGRNVAKEVPSSPSIFSMQNTIPSLVEGKELFDAETSPRFGWNVGIPSGGHWKVGDLLVEKTPYNPQLRVCTTEQNPAYQGIGTTNAWKSLFNTMGLPVEVCDFNSLDDLDGWTYNLLSDLSTFPVAQPLTAAQVTVANSKLNQVVGGWEILLSPASQGFADGVWQINCKPGQPSGHILRAGSTTQGLLVNQAHQGGGVWELRLWGHAGGTWASLGLYVLTHALDNNAFYTYTFVLSGNVLSVYIDDILVVTWNTAAINTGGTRYGWRQNGNFQQFACWTRMIPLAGIPWNEV